MDGSHTLAHVVGSVCSAAAAAVAAAVCRSMATPFLPADWHGSVLVLHAAFSVGGRGRGTKGWTRWVESL